MTTSFPASGALLRIDYGTKRVGFALSTPDQSLACPLETLQRSQAAQDARQICKICNDYRVVGLVVGLPVHMSGSEGGKAREARQFGDWCGELTGLPVLYWDERFTSSMAENHLREFSLSRKRRKKHIDKLAAQLILQSFLDAPNRHVTPSAMRDAPLE